MSATPNRVSGRNRKRLTPFGFLLIMACLLLLLGLVMLITGFVQGGSPTPSDFAPFYQSVRA